MSNITISLPDGSERELPDGATALDLASSIGRRLAKAAVAATVDGVETDLTRPLDAGSTVAIITAIIIEDEPVSSKMMKMVDSGAPRTAPATAPVPISA